eukprot:Rmarinus@m.27460
MPIDYFARENRNAHKRTKQFAAEKWSVLRAALLEIWNERSGSLQYSVLFQVAYDLVHYGHAEFLRQNLVAALMEHLTAVREKIAQLPEEDLVIQIVKLWERGTAASIHIQSVLRPLSEHYCSGSRMDFFQESLRLYVELVVSDPRILPKLRDFVLDLVYRERERELIDRSVLRRVLRVLVDMSLETYQTVFESALLESSRNYYRDEGVAYITVCSCPEFLRRVELRVQEEEERAWSCMQFGTVKLIGEMVLNEMLRPHVTTLIEMENSGLTQMLENEMLDDLRSMCRLFYRVDGGLEGAAKHIHNYIRKAGMEVVSDERFHTMENNYIVELVRLEKQMSRIAADCFACNKIIVDGISQAFTVVLNESERSAELLSIYLRSRLRAEKSHISEEKVDACIEDTLSLFRYIQNKDNFACYYQRHLAKSLLDRRTVSKEAERQVLAKLKVECGESFTATMEAMFKDIEVSDDLNVSFLEYLRQHDETVQPVGLSVRVLTTGAWPISNDSYVKVPQCVVPICDKYRAFFLSNHRGKKLSWCMLSGGSELVGRFGADLSDQYHVFCSPLAMCVLLKFNDTPTYTFEQIVAETGISSKELKDVLATLACGKKRMILKDPAELPVLESDRFHYNPNFSSHNKRFKLAANTILVESPQNAANTLHHVEDERGPQVEAAIVRIMKSRKTLDHVALVMEVTRTLAPFFIPPPAAIKRRIESLLDRDYLVRDMPNARAYNYVA